MQEDMQLEPCGLAGRLRSEEGNAPIPGARWYTAEAKGDGLIYLFAKGALAGFRYLTTDLLFDGKEIVQFELQLREGEGGAIFRLAFGVLPQCQARLRLPLNLVRQKLRKYRREGALLDPLCSGDRMDLDKVDRMVIEVLGKSDPPARFCLTPVIACRDEPERLCDPILPKGPLLDKLGQSALRAWPAKTGGLGEMVERLHAQLESAESQRWPEGWSRWGGLRDLRFEATGFFHTHHDGKRWWLVDPDGCAFWSAGCDCVGVNTAAAYEELEKVLSWMPDRDGEYAEIYHGRPPGTTTINYLRANLIRAFGSEQAYAAWAKIALSELRRMGFNTVGNWSDWQIARDAGVPYVRQLNFSPRHSPLITRGFPDVYHPAFHLDAVEFAEGLRETADDPALIGYFLMNEPEWGFVEEPPAVGMLYATPGCECRIALQDFLVGRYGSDAGLSAAWGMDVRLARIAEGEWRGRLTETALADLQTFSTIMVDRLFATLRQACSSVDIHHLNLGVRYWPVPPQWIVEGMRHFDVFSTNPYEPRVWPELAGIAERLHKPILVGEFHFGALDVGLPASGYGHVRDQRERGKAYRIYLEDAASKPWCVGAHWFAFYDQSALGRYDGECFNIGFLDVCNQPYQEIGSAARTSHERLYAVAKGEAAPYEETIEYLPVLVA